jgi:uncharacterized protein YdhG (YjbR/CyaY superfamily)
VYPIYLSGLWDDWVSHNWEVLVADTFSKEEKAAMRAAAAERRRKFTPEEHAADVLENYQAMDPSDREIGLRVHELVMAAAPGFAPKTWYGMPAYHKDGKNICFFQAPESSRFDTARSVSTSPPISMTGQCGRPGLQSLR